MQAQNVSIGQHHLRPERELQQRPHVYLYILCVISLQSICRGLVVDFHKIGSRRGRAEIVFIESPNMWKPSFLMVDAQISMFLQDILNTGKAYFE